MALAEQVETKLRPEPIRVVSVTVVSGTHTHNHATVVAEVDGKCRTFESTGARNGPIDAICHAFEPLVGKFEVVTWSGKSEGKGSDSVGAITVLLRQDEAQFAGSGRDENVLDATAKAIADAFDKFRYFKWSRGA